MYQILEKLISKKYYTDAETAKSKVDICFAMNKITEAQYASLTELIDEKYEQ